MVIQFQFLNVPPIRKLQLTDSCMCKGCGEANVTPLQVYTCRHILCGHCWQKSSCDIGDEENKCMVCDTPTELLCFKDHDRFLGYNLHNGTLRSGASCHEQTLREYMAESETRSTALDELRAHERNMLDCILLEAKKKRCAKQERIKNKKTKRIKVEPEEIPESKN